MPGVKRSVVLIRRFPLLCSKSSRYDLVIDEEDEVTGHPHSEKKHKEKKHHHHSDEEDSRKSKKHRVMRDL